MKNEQIEALEKLAALKEKGALTEDEFEKQKKEILNKVVQTAAPEESLPENPNRNIFQCYADCFKKYFQFNGRSSRYEYWSFYLVNLMINLVLSIPVLAVLSLIYSLAVLIPGLAVAVRRMHDINKSGWKLLLPIGLYTLLFVVLAAVGAVFSYTNNESPVSETIKTVLFICLGGFGTLALIIIYLYWMFKKGDATANKYGPAPFAEEKKHRRVVIIAGVLMLLLPVLGILSVGMIAGYSKADQKFKLNKSADQISLIVVNTRALFSLQDSYDLLSTSIAKEYHIIPEDMITESGSVVNPYGGEVRISGLGKSFELTFAAVPEKICTQLTEFENSEGIISAKCTKCHAKKCDFELESY